MDLVLLVDKKGNYMKPTKKMVLKALRHSENARQNKEELDKVYPGCFFLDSPETDTQGFVFQKDVGGKYDVYIFFRGTQQIRDWLTDLNAFHTVYPYGNRNSKIRVHQGFIKAYKSVRSDIHRILNNIRGDLGQVIIGGHSLGGALSILCAVDIQYNFTDCIECYPSGNPMPGNKAFAESYNSRVPLTFRTYMRKDVVPLMPPKWFGKYTNGGYTHAGNPNPIGPGKFWYGLINWIKRHFKSANIAADLTNHSMALYKQEAGKMGQ